METNIFDIFSLICIHTFGKKILKQLYLHTAFIRLLIVEACLFIEIVTLGSSYGSTILADDICKALFSLSILSFVVIFVFIGISAYLTFEQDHNPLERSNKKFSEHQWRWRYNCTGKEDLCYDKVAGIHFGVLHDFVLLSSFWSIQRRSYFDVVYFYWFLFWFFGDHLSYFRNIRYIISHIPSKR